LIEERLGGFSSSADCREKKRKLLFFRGRRQKGRGTGRALKYAGEERREDRRKGGRQMACVNVKSDLLPL